MNAHPRSPPESPARDGATHRARLNGQSEDELLDTIVQRLFATGLSLQRAAALLADDPTAARDSIERVIDDLDGTVRTIHDRLQDIPAPRA